MVLGPTHLSSPVSFDRADFNAEIANNPHMFDTSYTRWGPIEWMPPERFLELDAALLARGWTATEIAAVTSGNFARVASETW